MDANTSFEDFAREVIQTGRNNLAAITGKMSETQDMLDDLNRRLGEPSESLADILSGEFDAFERIIEAMTPSQKGAVDKLSREDVREIADRAEAEEGSAERLVGQFLRARGLLIQAAALGEAVLAAFAGGNAVGLREALSRRPDARLDAPNGEGNTLLHVAALNASEEGEWWDVVDALIDAGAPPEVRNRRGETFLMLLVKLGVGLDRLRKYLELGADPNAPDGGGMTPTDYAYLGSGDYETEGDEEAGKLLREFGGKPTVEWHPDEG